MMKNHIFRWLYIYIYIILFHNEIRRWISITHHYQSCCWHHLNSLCSNSVAQTHTIVAFLKKDLVWSQKAARTMYFHPVRSLARCLLCLCSTHTLYRLTVLDVCTRLIRVVSLIGGKQIRGSMSNICDI